MIRWWCRMAFRSAQRSWNRWPNWAEVVARQAHLEDLQICSSLRNLIASRILNGAVAGVDDAQELRRRALDGIL
jgi:hypothetical protein